MKIKKKIKTVPSRTLLLKKVDALLAAAMAKASTMVAMSSNSWKKKKRNRGEIARERERGGLTT